MDPDDATICVSIDRQIDTEYKHRSKPLISFRFKSDLAELGSRIAKDRY